MLSAQEQAEFHEAVDKVRHSVLSHIVSKQSLAYVVNFVANMQRGVDDISQAAQDSGAHFDCKAGCSHCCNVRVEAIEPEIFRIAHALEQLAPQSLETIIEAMQDYVSKTRGLSVWEHRIACPFLQQNLCSIYPVRPARCRKAHSFDVDKCATAGADIPESLEVALKSEAMMQGTSLAYIDALLPASGHELVQAVLLALSDKTAESRWYAGETPFGK
jgi:Fe-S-cluster containining protein